jgi:hypothetical protein
LQPWEGVGPFVTPSKSLVGFCTTNGGAGLLRQEQDAAERNKPAIVAPDRMLSAWCFAACVAFGLAARVGTPIVQHEFSAANCAASVFQDTSTIKAYGALTKTGTVTCVSGRNGITSPNVATAGDALVISSADSTATVQKLDEGTNGFTIEIWLMHTANTGTTKTMPILSISKQTQSTVTKDVCDQQYNNFELARKGSDYKVMSSTGALTVQ